LTKPADDSFLLADIAPDDYLEQAGLLMASGKFREAITFYEGALAHLERSFGEDQPQLIDCLQELALAYEAAVRYSDAMRVYLRLLRLTREVTGEMSAVPALLLKLTQMNEKLGRPSDALNYCSQALQAAKETLAQEDPVSQQIIERYRHLTALSGSQFGQKQDSWQFADPDKTAKPLEEAGFRSTEERAESKTAHQNSRHEFDKNQGKPSSLHTNGQTFAGVNASYPQEDFENSDEPPLVFEYVDSADPQRTDETKQSNADIYSQIKANRARPGLDLESGLSPARRARDIAIPILALATIVGLLVFFLAHKTAGPTVQPATTSSTASPGMSEAPGGIEARYKTADGEKELLLDNKNMATFATVNSATEMPYRIIAGDWNGLIAAMLDSVQEKQIWGEKKQSEFKGQDNVVYYAADGPEALVIAKMKRLAGYGQGCFLRTGEYPKIVNSEVSNQFIFTSPIDNHDTSIAIKTITDPSADEKASLQSGALVTDEPPLQPCLITCYAQMSTMLDAKGEKLKATKFFVRGCDRGGHFLSDSRGKIFVITASDEYLVPLETLEMPQTKTKPAKRSNQKSRNAKSLSKLTKAPDPVSKPIAEKVQEQSSIFMGRQKDRPEKPTTLWLVSAPPCPLVVIHYILPLLLSVSSLLAFLASQLTGVDMKGRDVTSGSKPALFLAAILLALAVIALFLQCIFLA